MRKLVAIYFTFVYALYFAGGVGSDILSNGDASDSYTLSNVSLSRTTTTAAKKVEFPAKYLRVHHFNTNKSKFRLNDGAGDNTSNSLYAGNDSDAASAVSIPVYARYSKTPVYLRNRVIRI